MPSTDTFEFLNKKYRKKPAEIRHSIFGTNICYTLFAKTHYYTRKMLYIYMFSSRLNRLPPLCIEYIAYIQVHGCHIGVQ